MIADPERALETIAAVGGAALCDEVRTVRIDHSATTAHDLAAESVLGQVALLMRNHKTIRAKRCRLEGEFPHDRSAQRLVRALGISHSLGVAEADLPMSEREKVVLFERKRPTRLPIAGGAIADDKGDVIKEFVDHINDCLRTVNLELQPQAVEQLCRYTGELIDNIEQHAESPDWYLTGYLDTTLGPPMCEVAIYNFGHTFAETFQTLDEKAFPRQQVAPYVDRHQTLKLFSAGWQEDDLLTLVALQGGISCKASGPEDNRGQGTVELVQFFQEMYEECRSGSSEVPEMAILSGGTHIKFDGTYRMAENSDGRWAIAFNESNSLNDPPDRRYVRHLEGVFFPGTVVSIRFALQQTHTHSDANAGK